VISFRSVNLYIILFALSAGLLSITGILNFSSLEIISYASILLGLNIFYSSFIKHNRVGVFVGSLIFQLGAIVFVFAQFEILGFGRIIIPTLLFMIGFSLLLTNLATAISKMTNILSIIMMTAGIIVILNRSNTDWYLYLSSVYAIVKNYWIIILAAIAVIYFTLLEIKKRNMDGS
jgi:hypothetical protein